MQLGTIDVQRRALRLVYSICLSDIDSIDCGRKYSSAKFDGAALGEFLFTSFYFSSRLVCL